MQGISELITAIARWLISFSPWPVRIRPTHRAVAFQHRFRFRFVPRKVLRLLPLPVAKRVVRYIPFSKKKHSWCRTVTLGPGIHWHWPKTTEIEVIPVERQTLDLPVQTLWTSDLRNMSVRAEVVFCIEDVRLAICRTFDFQQTIQDVAQLAVVEVVAPKTSEQLGGIMQNTELIEELTNKLQCKLKSYGVRVERAFLAEFTSSTVVRVYGDQVAGTLPLLDQLEPPHC